MFIGENDKVKVVGLSEDTGSDFLQHNKRYPQVGDIGTVTGIYSLPYLCWDVECRDGTDLLWKCTMRPGEIVLIESDEQPKSE
jgi:hypothetical protein